MAFRGQETLWSERFELHGDLQPHPSLGKRQRKKDVIPKSIQLIAGRTGQEYNQRKNREIQSPHERYAFIDYEGLRKLLEYRGMAELADGYRGKGVRPIFLQT